MKVKNKPIHHRGEHNVSGTTRASFLAKFKSTRNKLGHKRYRHRVPKTLCVPRYIIIWEHGEEYLEEFLNKLNSFHPTIKFTAEYSKETINFLDVNIRLVEGELMTDLFVKSTDTNQFLNLSSSHPYHCKKGTPYSQALRPNRICSDNESFDKRCNDLEGWLMERGIMEK